MGMLFRVFAEKITLNSEKGSHRHDHFQKGGGKNLWTEVELKRAIMETNLWRLKEGTTRP